MEVKLLKRNEITDLTKGLNKIKVILGWEKQQKDICSNFDLDTVAIMLDKKDKILDEQYLIFFAQKKSPCDAIIYSKDNNSNENNKNVFFIDLEKVPENIEKIAFIVSIYEAERRNQNFGLINNAYIKIIDFRIY